MGEDLYWAIRGGGGGSFGIITAWKVKLVPVPSTVTIFTVTKSLEQGATKLLFRWQQVADKLDEDLFIRVNIQTVNVSNKGGRTITTSYDALFLGDADRLLQVMRESFPELGLTRQDCIETSWINSTVYLGGYTINTSPEVLLQRRNILKHYFKAKSGFVRQPIPETPLKGLWEIMLEEDNPAIVLTPSFTHFSKKGIFGASTISNMGKFSESQTPSPHRKGTLFMIQYLANWRDAKENVRKHTDWTRMVYRYMKPYVSMFPRQAYVSMFPRQAYVKDNFYRLVRVKTKVDPDNFFRHEQGIPTLPHHTRKRN
ncbi:hypothetical protein NC651_027647 [Populus alba x Populus x berolinensis]|nr:hypothetical protein NC651_027647 [Populus alba x Populus x berolinensis]